jgi:hypothetical protein
MKTGTPLPTGNRVPRWVDLPVHGKKPITGGLVLLVRQLDLFKKMFSLCHKPPDLRLGLRQWYDYGTLRCPAPKDGEL